ncbi:hypothetical protein GBA52_025107 [Prunus armeniaca]|nr:hypothetical protein GBA52_025107 [Prunus armeniaca]
MRTAMISTGTKRSTNGGGGSGGKSSGSTTKNTVKIVKTMIDMTLKLLNIKALRTQMLLSLFEERIPPMSPIHAASAPSIIAASKRMLRFKTKVNNTKK